MTSGGDAAEAQIDVNRRESRFLAALGMTKSLERLPRNGIFLWLCGARSADFDAACFRSRPQFLLFVLSHLARCYTAGYDFRIRHS